MLLKTSQKKTIWPKKFHLFPPSYGFSCAMSMTYLTIANSFLADIITRTYVKYLKF